MSSIQHLTRVFSGNRVLLVLGFLLIATLIVVAASGAGVDPTSTKTVSKTIVMDYSLGNYNGEQGTPITSGDGGTYSKSYTLQFPDSCQHPITTTLQVYSEGGQCEANFSAVVCSSSGTEITVMITRVDTDAPWEQHLRLKAVNFMK